MKTAFGTWLAAQIGSRNFYWVKFLLLLSVSLLFLRAVPAVCQQVGTAEAAVGQEEFQNAPIGRVITGLAVNNFNLAEYKELIVPELLSDLKTGAVEMDMLPDLDYQWEMGPDWLLKADKGRAVLSSEGELEIHQPLGRGFLFALNEDDQDTRKGSRLGHEILWNVHALFWSQKSISFDFRLRIIKEDKVQQELQGRLARIYPGQIIQNDKTAQLFRELIRFNAPKLIDYYSWLTFRFLDAEEDVLWVYSPATSQARQLTGSNRSDPIANTISADDFLLWSGKPDLVETVVAKPAKYLTPFFSGGLGKAKSDDACSLIEETLMSSSQKESDAKWNFGSQKYVQGASWLPSDVIFVPRSLWRIEMTSKDPYSLYGRQILYVDAAAMLPVYKFVYDRAGVHWKTAIAAFGLSESQDRRRLPFPSVMVVNDLKLKQSYLLDYINVRYCDGFPPGIQAESFNPHKLAPQEEQGDQQPVEKGKGKGESASGGGAF